MFRFLDCYVLWYGLFRILPNDRLRQGWGTCGLKATCGLLSHEVRPSVAYGSSLKLKLRIIHLTPKSSKYQFCKR